jgi:MOSC domain-containing protein YiiM
MHAGIVRAVYIAPVAKESMLAVPQILAVPGKGLEGDRYFLGCGSFSRWPGTGRDVSLIASEAIEAIRLASGIDLGDGRSRRNIVTEGVDLASLQGRRFRVGTALLQGVRECQPCLHLERLTEPGVFEALKGRGGWRAEVLEEGVIRVNDRIELMEPYPGGGGGLILQRAPQPL